MKIAICDVKAFHYLIKPVDDAKLFCALDDLLKTISLPQSLFTAQTDRGFCKIFVDDVDYLEAQNKEVLVHLSDGRIIAILGAARFSAAAFLHQFYITSIYILLPGVMVNTIRKVSMIWR